MSISAVRRATRIKYRNQKTAKTLETLFLAYLIYSLTAVPLGINVPYLAGGWLSLIAFLSFFNVDWKKSSRTPMILILAISISFLLIQFLVYENSLSASYMWPFVMWVISAMIMFTLSERPGFIKRLAVVMFFIGLYLRLFVITKMDIVARQRLESGSGIDNSNDYAAWVGFCALVFWLWNWNSTKKSHTLLLWASFAVSVLFLLSTVSRGALLCLIIGILVGLRKMPFRKWLGIAFILGLAFFILQMFSSTLITNYQLRLYEESGRLSRWPVALESFIAQPWLGYGVERVAHKGAGIDMTPHNGILFLGLASGILPTIFFVIMWWLAISRSYRDKLSATEDIDTLPLVTFAFLEMMQSNLYFMAVWSMAALFVCFREKPSVEQVEQVEQVKPHAINRRYVR
jgi:O-antigen ligase